MTEVRFCNPPAYDEIGVKALYEKILKQQYMPKYFPSKLPKGRQMGKVIVEIVGIGIIRSWVRVRTLPLVWDLVGKYKKTCVVV